MFVAIFAFVLITTYVAAEIPSYIHVCGRRDPNVDQCILNNINNMKSKICKGISDLDIPSNDPFVIDKLVLSDSPELKIFIKNVKILGFCDFNITSFRADINTLHYNVELEFDKLQLNSTYDFDIHLLVPLAHKGNVYLTTDNIGANVTLNFKIITRGDTKYTYLEKIKLNLDIKNYDIQFDQDVEHQLNEIIRNFLGQNQKEVIKVVKPAIEEIISKRILLISNIIAKHFTYEELFPDRT